MNRLLIFLLTLLLPILGTAPLWAQQKDKKVVVKVHADTTIKTTTQGIKQNAKSDAATLKSSLKTQTSAISPDSTKGKVLKSSTQQQTKKLLEDKTSNLDYNSEDPDNAPWKKQQISKDDLNGFGTPTMPKAETPDVKGMGAKYEGQVKATQPALNEDAAKAKASQGVKQNAQYSRATNAYDSLTALKGKATEENLREQLIGAQKIYSDKQMRKAYDSLGGKKADSLFKVTSPYLKKDASKQDLLDKINSPLEGKRMNGIGMSGDSLAAKDADKLGGLPQSGKDMDLSKVKLPDSLLSDLPPLSGKLIDSKYIDVLDSMRDVALKKKNMKLDEQQVSDEVKKSTFKKKPRFLDKIYFEGILGFVNDSTFSIVQISPSLGYHFAKYLSVGLGPNISVQLHDKKKLDMMAGFRTFVKAEVWKQRAYLQVEDNVDPRPVNREVARKATHSVLAGGGGLLPIGGKLALNLAVFYRVTKTEASQSPWVFRIGLSSVKKTKTK